MKKKIALLIVLSALLLSVMVAPALAQTRVVGVKVGDWFKYVDKVTQYESAGPFPPPLSPLTLADNETNSIVYTVTGIVEDVINFTVAYNWQNGTTTYEKVNENVTFSPDMLAIGANMAEGDMARDTFLFMGFYQWPALYLNASINLVNANATRETNVCEYSIDIYGSNYNYTLYWDKATGMRVYYENSGIVGAIESQPAYDYTVKWELVDSSYTNVAIPEGPISLIVGMSLAVPAVLLPTVLLRKRKKLLT
jgi:hypothetical protein